MEKTKAFHIINKGQKSGALRIAKLIRESSALKVGYGWYGEGAYAHYYENINKETFKNEPMVIFEIDSKKIENQCMSDTHFILLKGEDMIPIEILEFRNIQGIK